MPIFDKKRKIASINEFLSNFSGFFSRHRVALSFIYGTIPHIRFSNSDRRFYLIGL